MDSSPNLPMISAMHGRIRYKNAAAISKTNKYTANMTTQPLKLGTHSRESLDSSTARPETRRE